MKGSPMSLWLSIANGTAGFWMGHAQNEMRRQGQIASRRLAAEMTKAVAGKAAPKKRGRKPVS
ncbi:MAG TPA: hypothetical protein VGD16_12990 [Enterovirga sp.]|jgi:hypothetical protein